jgi:hypothetical protein
MQARTGSDRFTAANYEINYFAELTALSTLLNTTNAAGTQTLQEALLTLDPVIVSGTTRQSSTYFHGFVLENETTGEALVWLVRRDRDNDPAPTTVDLTLLEVGSATWTSGTVRWFNPWTGAEIGAEANAVAFTNVPTRLDQVQFTRACAGVGDGSGAHEQEDVVIWITP